MYNVVTYKPEKETMQLKKEPNRSERMLRKKLKRRKKEGREALHSKRRKREDFFWKREKERRRNSHSREKENGTERKKNNVVPGIPLIGRKEERRKMGSIDLCNSWFYLLVVRRKEGRWEASVFAIPGSVHRSPKGKMEEGKHRFPVLLPRSSSLGAHGRTRDRRKCGRHQCAPRESVTHGRISGIIAPRPHVES